LAVSALAVVWLSWACGSSNSGGEQNGPTDGGEGNGVAGEDTGNSGSSTGATSSTGGSNGSAAGSTTTAGNASAGDATGGTATAGAPSGMGGADGLGGDATSGGTDMVGGAAGSGDPGVELPECTVTGGTCVQSTECCSGVCDPKTNSCASVVGMCAGKGQSCNVGTDCCSFQCGADKKCVDAACVSDTDECTDDAQCCSGNCDAGSCVPLNLECLTAGNACDTDGQCCSQDCGANGTCTLGGSYCIQPGDVCARDGDCCTGDCDMADGASLGVCAAPPSGSAFCTGVDGVLCNDCGDCCSRLCAPFGAEGVKICQPANGCHVTGDLCRRNEDCCGGSDDDTLPGYGNVVCQLEEGASVGLCRNPSDGPGDGGACNPQGNVCHFKDYECGVSSARANCCGGLGAKGGVCELDPLGVPRCNGLGETCREAGETCASTADCCNDVPCVPDEDGQLRCGTDSCQKSGDSCTVNADCCPGILCITSPGSTVGTCGGDPGGGTGGTGSGGSGGSGGTPACSQYGQICDGNDQCCNAVPCTNGICRYPAG
jgi:hypothetical protein